jgi:STAS-like domain of unknown function (DUF4325)
MICQMDYDSTVSVASDFSRFPSGRTPHDSAFSGEAFREKFLVQSLRQGKSICIQLDGAIGYGSSFLEEAFGGLVRVSKFDVDFLKSKLKFESFDDSLVEEIFSYIETA